MKIKNISVGYNPDRLADEVNKFLADNPNWELHGGVTSHCRQYQLGSLMTSEMTYIQTVKEKEPTPEVSVLGLK